VKGADFMNSKKILLIEDETKIARFVELELQHEGYLVKIEYNGIDGVKSAFNYQPDLILLDLMLPGLNGIDVCKKVREFSSVPVIMLTAMDDITTKVNGLDTGANDYITKPFAIEELLARIRSSLRVHEQTNSNLNCLMVGNLIMDFSKHIVKRANENIELTRREYDLLEYLIRNKGIVLTREQILNTVWGIDYEGDANVVDVYIKYLRDKIKDSPDTKLIHTVRGFGYLLEDKLK
jgi:two-component system, OmpR family, response regulator ArlR